MSEIKYVCFDIGGVVNIQTPNYIIASRASKHFGRNFSEEEWRNMIFPNAGGKDIWREFNNGLVTAEQYIEAAFRSVNIPATIENRIFLYRLLEDWCGVSYQPILNLVDTLKKNGYHTSVLSNNNEIMYNTPSAEAIKKRVDVAISSHEIYVSKPHWRTYATLLGKIQANAPGEVLFIDDKKVNIEAAIGCGLQGFHFRSKEIKMNDAFAELMTCLRGKGVRV